MKKRTLMILLNLLPVIASWIIVFHYYHLLPEEVPTHYGLHGPPDSWGCKSTIFTVPSVQAGVVALLLVLSLLVKRYPWMYNFPIDPKTLSDRVRDELYSLTGDLCLVVAIIVNLLFLCIVVTDINVALGVWGG
ncbi:MAG: DUF1648 domain-containing protein [Methanosarcinales archaeon]|nr:DUF1648 domain-containing protein [Methanosarcinales archaeon]MCK4810689.1 DUF1648 domain-containing protein [Methanosarcinales archaeon]